MVERESCLAARTALGERSLDLLADALDSWRCKPGMEPRLLGMLSLRPLPRSCCTDWGRVGASIRSQSWRGQGSRKVPSEGMLQGVQVLDHSPL